MQASTGVSRDTAPDEGPGPALCERITLLMGAPPVAWKHASGGYTHAERWSVRLADGRAAFIKAAVDAATAGWLRTEYGFYRNVHGPFMPGLLGWDDGQHPILALEDLSDADWPPPWRSGMVSSVLDAVAALHKAEPPDGLPGLESYRDELACWGRVRAEPDGFLGLGLCSREWLHAALPEFLAAEADAVLQGQSIVHFDLRSDNVCVRNGRAFLVDWNWACLGNPAVDVAFWIPSLAAEGGSEPEDVLPTAPGVPELAAMVAGYLAWNATKPDLRPGCVLRTNQRNWLRAALHWSARTLDLARP